MTDRATKGGGQVYYRRCASPVLQSVPTRGDIPQFILSPHEGNRTSSVRTASHVNSVCCKTQKTVSVLVVIK